MSRSRKIIFCRANLIILKIFCIEDNCPAKRVVKNKFTLKKSRKQEKIVYALNLSKCTHYSILFPKSIYTLLGILPENT